MELTFLVRLFNASFSFHVYFIFIFAHYFLSFPFNFMLNTHCVFPPNKSNVADVLRQAKHGQSDDECRFAGRKEEKAGLMHRAKEKRSQHNTILTYGNKHAPCITL